MISTKNPFPGMNLFLERTWAPVHTKLIGYIDDEIAAQLPDDLVTRPKERLVIDEIEPGKSYRGDVAVTEPWKQGVGPTWKPAGGTANGGIVLAEPQIVHVDEDIERWIEIRTAEGHLVTVIELLSPANKGLDWERYRDKQTDFLHSTANLVEIDLLRGGRFMLPVATQHLRLPAGTCYFVGVRRAARHYEREVYCCPLAKRLPAVRIPLRPTDRDIVLDLQPLIDRCYELGRYYKGRFDEIPDPPLSTEEAAWVEERLRAAGLRG